MSLEMEAKEYWTLVRGYRTAFSPIGKQFIGQIQIPTFALKATNHRIQHQLSLIMEQEGISNACTENLDPTCA